MAFHERADSRFSQRLEKSIRFLCRSVCVRFDDNIHIRSDFETIILAFLVSNNVLDANLPIQLVSFLKISGVNTCSRSLPKWTRKLGEERDYGEAPS